MKCREPHESQECWRAPFKRKSKYIYMNLWSFAGKERLRSKTIQSQPEWEKKRQTRRAQKKALALPSRELEGWTAKQVSESSSDQDFFLFGTVWRARRGRGLLPPRLLFLGLLLLLLLWKGRHRPPKTASSSSGRRRQSRHRQAQWPSPQNRSVGSWEDGWKSIHLRQLGLGKYF